MRRLWRPIDWLAEWLAESFEPRNQLRLGILLLLGSLPLLLWTLRTNEPKLIFFMSALALTLTGITIVFAAEVLERQKGFERQVRHALASILLAHGRDEAAADLLIDEGQT